VAPSRKEILMERKTLRMLEKYTRAKFLLESIGNALHRQYYMHHCTTENPMEDFEMFWNVIEGHERCVLLYLYEENMYGNWGDEFLVGVSEASRNQEGA
jgi:hypothetical protein